MKKCDELYFKGEISYEAAITRWIHNFSEFNGNDQEIKNLLALFEGYVRNSEEIGRKPSLVGEHLLYLIQE